MRITEDIEARKQRAEWTRLVPEITFVLYICKAIRNRVTTEEIASQAIVTYPKEFYTQVDGKKTPDLALILLTLNEAKKRKWGFVAGGWFKGWRLTRKGLQFAKDVERRARERSKKWTR